MSLVILSNHSLDTMEKWSKQHFSNVPNKGLPYMEPDGLPYGKEELG